MYLFTRRRMINPAKARAALGVVVESANRAKEITGLDIRAWTAVFSPELGTVVWSCRIEQLEQLEVAADKLANSNEFGDYVEQNDACFSGPLQDSLSQVVHGQFSEQVPEYINTTRAQAGPGAVSKAMALAVEIAETATRITGIPTIVTSGLTGNYGEVSWVSGAADLKVMETTQAKLAADAGWLPLIDRAGLAFQPNATTTLFRRLA